MGPKLSPGRVLVRNVYKGVDSSDSRYVALQNDDTGLEFKCRVDFPWLKGLRIKYADFLRTLVSLPGYKPVFINQGGYCLFIREP